MSSILRGLFSWWGGWHWPSPTPPPPPHPEPESPDLAAFAQQVFVLQNAERVDRGLDPYTVDPRLETSAVAYAQDMAQRERLDHFGRDGSTPWQRIEAAGYAWSSASENIGAQEISPEEVVDAWMSSPGHRLNILGPYRHCGVGVARDRQGTLYWCVDFGTPQTS